MVLKTEKLIITNAASTESNAEVEASGDDYKINKVLKFTNSGAFSATGSQSMKLTEGSSLGPNSASGGDVSKWLEVKDDNGSTLYVPAFV